MIDIINFNERVLAVLGGNPAITEEIINLPEYRGIAEQRIIDFVPNYKELVDFELMMFEVCVIYGTAINLFDYYSDNIFKIEQSPQVKIERFTQDMCLKLDSLKAKLNECLSLISPTYKEVSEKTYFGFVTTDTYSNPNTLL